MHIEVLTQEGARVFPFLENFSDFYLAGGTALALQIGHRISVDFDFFSDKKIQKTLLAKVERVFSGKKLEVSVNNADELTLFTDGVKLTFLHYPFPVLLPKIHENGIYFLNIREIGATKAYTIGRRGELKDYADVYFLIKETGISLEEITELAQKKYGEVFDKRLFFEQLLYFDDIEDIDVQFLKGSVTRDDLKRFFENEIRKIGI